MSVRFRRALLNPQLQRPSALKSVPRDPRLIWLDKNENLDARLMEFSSQLMHSIPRETLATYPEAGALYRKLAAWIGVTPDSLLLTPGSDGAIRMAFESVVEDGDPVVHTFPTFAMYPVYSQMFGARVHEVHYARSAAGPRLDAQELLRVVRTTQPKLLCLPNPDSPTGTVLSAEQLREILAECENTGTLLLIDEAYHPFHAPSMAQATQTSQNLIIARTFAKAWGVAGLRLGYAIGHPQTIALLHKLRPMYESSSLAIEFMTRMLDHTEQMLQSVARIAAGKAAFESHMRRLGFDVLQTFGNFSHVGFGERAQPVHAALAGRVLYRAGFDHPCLAGYSRFSVAPEAVMAQVAELIEQSLEARQ